MFGCERRENKEPSYSPEKAMAPHSSTLAWKNPMDGGAWKAAVHGVAEGWIRLSDFTFTFHFHALEKEMETHSSVLVWSGLPFPSPVHESEKWKWSRSVVSNPQQPHGLQPSRLLRYYSLLNLIGIISIFPSLLLRQKTTQGLILMFASFQHSHHGWFQAANIILLNVELGLLYEEHHSTAFQPCRHDTINCFRILDNSKMQ